MIFSMRRYWPSVVENGLAWEFVNSRPPDWEEGHPAGINELELITSPPLRVESCW